jgi:hypothetical protein
MNDVAVPSKLLRPHLLCGHEALHRLVEMANSSPAFDSPIICAFSMLNHQQESIRHLPSISFPLKAEYSALKATVLRIIRSDNSKERTSDLPQLRAITLDMRIALQGELFDGGTQGGKLLSKKRPGTHFDANTRGRLGAEPSQLALAFKIIG